MIQMYIALLTNIVSILLIIAGIGWAVSSHLKDKIEKEMISAFKHLPDTHHIPCQSVEGETADRAVTFIKITGMLLAMRYERYTKFLSPKGHVKELIKVLLYNIFLGWWGIKSFIFNIGAIANNFFTLFNHTKIDKLRQEAKVAKFTEKETPAKESEVPAKTHKASMRAAEKPGDVGKSKSLGIVALIVSFFANPIGLIVAIILYNKIAKNPDKYTGLGLAKAGIWIGSIFTAMIVLSLLGIMPYFLGRFF
jgi:hypothetical protein